MTNIKKCYKNGITDVKALSETAFEILNENVELEYLDDLYRAEPVDVLLAADVLYDQCNRFFLDEFLKFAPEVWVADSRVKNFSHPQYQKIDERSATTWPDLDEAKEFRNVSFYKTLN